MEFKLYPKGTGEPLWVSAQERVRSDLQPDLRLSSWFLLAFFKHLLDTWPSCRIRVAHGQVGKEKHVEMPHASIPAWQSVAHG